MENLEKLLKGDRKTLAQTITLVENQDSQTKDIIKELYKYTSNSCIIGITGSPGSGKSTLVDKLIAHYRAKSKTIGVIAVDPTSPFTGGALLGDRIRMSTRNRDKNVFIRSMGTRGSLGGFPVLREMLLMCLMHLVRILF
jgi:LAO/AO transport system kinase